MAKKNKTRTKSLKEQPKSDQPTATVPQKTPYVTYLIIFIAGFLCGIAFTVIKDDSPGAENTEGSNQAVQQQDSQSQQAILNLEAEVTSNPDNHQAWVRLGHLYFDTNQPKKAIGAYTKSLELHPGDANILTDLGVMYRRDQQPEKAVELFNQAIAKDPTHIPSRFNKGIVLLYDLKKTEEAVASWESILRINPSASTANGEPMQQFIDRIKSEHSANK